MPTKHIKTENALIGVGGEVLALLDTGKTVSRLFHDMQDGREQGGLPTLQFDWFLLSLDFLYTVGAIRLDSGLIRKLNQ